MNSSFLIFINLVSVVPIHEIGQKGEDNSQDQIDDSRGDQLTRNIKITIIYSIYYLIITQLLDLFSLSIHLIHSDRLRRRHR